MKFYLFPKLLHNLSVEDLMRTCRELGLDGPTALIRSGYWVERETLRNALPRYVKAASDQGLSVTYAEPPFSLEEIPSVGEELKVMADCGITDFRVDFISKRIAGPYRNLQSTLRPMVEKAAEAAGQAGLRMVIQIHGHCYPHNATAAYALVEGLDPATVGVKMDPGNNLSQEGYELFDYQIELLGEYIAALGAKDAVVHRVGEGKQWTRSFAPAYEGMADFPLIFRELKKIGFDGSAVLMPFYHENNPALFMECLKKEIDYFKAVEQSVWSESI